MSSNQQAPTAAEITTSPTSEADALKTRIADLEAQLVAAHTHASRQARTLYVFERSVALQEKQLGKPGFNLDLSAHSPDPNTSEPAPACIDCIALTQAMIYLSLPLYRDVSDEDIMTAAGTRANGVVERGVRDTLRAVSVVAEHRDSKELKLFLEIATKLAARRYVERGEEWMRLAGEVRGAVRGEAGMSQIQWESAPKGYEERSEDGGSEGR